MSTKKNKTAKTTKASKTTASKVDPKRLKQMNAILDRINGGDDEESDEEGSAGKIQCILTLHIKGFSNSEIVAAGFNKSTVYRQVGEYKKLKKAPATHYQGFPIYEARVQQVMKKKACSRAEAIKWIDQQDIKALEAND